MKKIIRLTASSLLAIFAISCSSLEIKEDNPSVSLQDCGFCAQNGTASEKTHIGTVTGDSAPVLWDNGDALTVFSKTVSSPSNRKFTISNIQGSTADFSGQIEETTTAFVAVYPYNSAASYSGGKISGYAIPTTQTANSGSFVSGTALSLADGTRTPGVPECGTINFKNLCSVISFTLPSDITFAKSITITAKGGAKMAGAVELDVQNKSLSGASSDVINLTGTFAGGSTYYVLVAPGTYSGFTFQIATNGGNSYTRETTKSFTAAAGEIYPLGKLSLLLTSDDFTSSVSISHTIENGVLMGSKAVFSLNPKAEFASAIKHYNVTVSLLKGNTVCRTLSYDSDSKPASAEMALSNGYHYLPKDDYFYSAAVIYTVGNGTKDVLRTVNLVGAVSAGSPSSEMKPDAVFTGHTSYDTYKSSGASSANTENGSAVYGVGASYNAGTGMSSNVYSQCSAAGILPVVTSTFDGQDFSGDKNDLSWSSHTIGAKWSFDGASGTCPSTKIVYVTGLPYQINTTATSFGWTQTGDFGEKNGFTAWAVCTKGGQSKTAYGLSPKFSVPSDINVTVKVPAYVYGGSLPGNMLGSMYIGASNSNAKVGSATSISTTSGLYPDVASYMTVSRDITLSNSVGVVCVAVDSQRKKSAAIYTISVGVYTQYINISYR